MMSERAVILCRVFMPSDESLQLPHTAVPYDIVASLQPFGTNFHALVLSSRSISKYCGNTQKAYAPWRRIYLVAGKRA